MPACLRAALDRRHRVAGHHQPRTRGRAARSVRHHSARRAGQGRGNRQADYTAGAVGDGRGLRVAAVRGLPRATRRQRDVHALLRSHRRRRPDVDRKWRRNRRRRRRLNRVSQPQGFRMAAGPQLNEELEKPELSLIMDELEAGEAAVELDDKEPQEVLAWAIERFGKELAICCSFQADGCALIDMAHKIDPHIRVFTIDTGRMPQETYDVIDKYRQRYGIKVEVFMPDTAVVQQMVTRHGNNLFYNDVNLRLLCCQVRKVLPLRRALMNYDAWITGLRRDQWATRSNIRKLEIDHDHGGIVKFAPLADWTDEEVWDYIRANDVPYNELYDKGFKSIGCAPCTRTVPEGA